MLCAVGGFAIEKGLVAANSPVTRVRIRNVNTNTFVDADIQTPDGHTGDASIIKNINPVAGWEKLARFRPGGV
jgi:2-methylaconitate cis-trans-isomerase PrpF